MSNDKQSVSWIFEIYKDGEQHERFMVMTGDEVQAELKAHYGDKLPEYERKKKAHIKRLRKLAENKRI